MQTEENFDEVRDELREFGYCALRFTGFHGLKAWTDLFSEHVGEPQFSRWHSLRPTEEKNASPVSYSGMFGTSEFPMHTDMANWRLPPRYLLLWAETGAPDVKTPLVDCHKMLDRLGRATLERALVKPRRPVKGKLPLLRLAQRIGPNASLVRWDSVFLKPASPSGEIGMRAMLSEIKSSEKIDYRLAKSGEGVIIDNWRILHGRSKVEDGFMQRKIWRAYLGAAY